MPGHLHISPNSYFLGFEWNILSYDPSNHDGDDGNHERCAYVKVWKKVLPSQEGDGKPEGTPHLVNFISWSRDDDEADYDDYSECSDESFYLLFSKLVVFLWFIDWCSR